MAITTDIIVGFPGESEDDFEATLQVMEAVRFDNSYSFAFSPRPGTVAAEMQESLTQAEKLARLQLLQAKQEEITSSKLESWVGRSAEVLVDDRNQLKGDCFQGRISQGFMANFDRPFEPVKLGALVPVRITGRKRFTLIAEPEVGCS
jgi:tRNA-2-methylthio-N6-dimethylallyladenosine synthase